MSEQTISITMDFINPNAPSLPDAKRGDVHSGPVKETQEQLDNDLIWCPCAFCESRVLVLTYSRGEKCSCGAKRFNRKDGEGWKRDGIEWWFC